MRHSLQKKVTLFITGVMLLTGAFSTALFTSEFSRSRKQALVLRGTELCYSLSKASEEGLAREDLSLIKKASSIVQAPDVTLAQVFSRIWEPVDAYPQTARGAPPHPDAVRHFKGASAPFYAKTAEGYDFYRPILFRPFEDSPGDIVGFARITLSASLLRKELKGIAAVNLAGSLVIALIAIATLTYLIRRSLVRPVMALHRSVTRFKDGALPERAVVARESTDELRELDAELWELYRAIREKEQKLTESEQRIRSLFERVEHAIFRIDTRGIITDANSRFRDLFGGVTELCDILIGDINASNCLRRATAEKVLHAEDKAVAKNGEEIIISISLYAERNDSGELTGFDGYIIDITEKKRLEERLMRSQKLEAVGTLAAGMAHDFNNLLTGILGYSGLMLKNLKESDPYHKPVSVIHDAATRGAALGKKILTMTRKERMEAKPVLINDIVRNTVELLRTSVPGNIDIVTKLDALLPPSLADPSQLQQVLINLAMNARDAMPGGGRLTIETSVANPADGLGGPFPSGEPGFIKLSLSDTGLGMDSTTRSKIFDPFFTTKEVGKGTGLGLYIVHSIVSNHGGYINVYSEPGQGTRFNIYLPAAKDVQAQPPVEAGEIRGVETVLVIDDEADVRELCKDMLVPLGYTVLVAESGSAGVKLYREKREVIALVVLDMIMPKQGGNEVFHALRTINRNVAVLLCSGYSHNNFAGINELLKSGAAGFVQKPFSLQELGIAVRKALEKKAHLP